VSEEFLEEWDWESGKPTGRKVERTLSHRTGVPHEGVHLWIVSLFDGVPHILLQRRAATKALFPGYLDITVGGHVPFGLEGGKITKEAEEELGITPDEASLSDLGYFRYEERTPEFNLFHREFQHVYLLRDDRLLSGYRFCDGEVDALAAVPISSFRGILAGDLSCEGLVYDGTRTIRRLLTRREFHPLFFTGPMSRCVAAVLRAADGLFPA
jgi:isopentenyldiphosphate isomerase